jgi:hypothetical protein
LISHNVSLCKSLSVLLPAWDKIVFLSVSHGNVYCMIMKLIVHKSVSTVHYNPQTIRTAFCYLFIHPLTHLTYFEYALHQKLCCFQITKISKKRTISTRNLYSYSHRDKHLWYSVMRTVRGARYTTVFHWIYAHWYIHIMIIIDSEFV